MLDAHKEKEVEIKLMIIAAIFQVYLLFIRLYLVTNKKKISLCLDNFSSFLAEVSLKDSRKVYQKLYRWLLNWYESLYVIKKQLRANYTLVKVSATIVLRLLFVSSLLCLTCYHKVSMVVSCNACLNVFHCRQDASAKQ